MKNWLVQIGGDQPFPFLVIDNWYDEETEKSIWSELDFLSTKNKQDQLRAENTIVSHAMKMELLKANHIDGISVESIQRKVKLIQQ